MRHRLADASRPVVLFANGVGDHFLNYPALKGLLQVFGGRISLIGLRHLSEGFLGHLPWTEFHVADFDSGPDGRRFDPAPLAERFGECDLFLSLNPWHSEDMTALLASLRGAESVGFFSPFDHELPLDFGKHSADLAFDVVSFLDPSLRLEEFADAPPLPEEERAAARELRAQIPNGYRLLALHTETSSRKSPPVEQMRAMLTAVLSAFSDIFVIVVDRSDCGLDAGPHGDRVIPSRGLNLGSSFALIAESDLFLGVDSCMLHAADFFRIPGIGLFGPTDVHEFGFRLAPHRHVRFDAQTGSVDAGAVVAAMADLRDGLPLGAARLKGEAS